MDFLQCRLIEVVVNEWLVLINLVPAYSPRILC